MPVDNHIVNNRMTTFKDTQYICKKIKENPLMFGNNVDMNMYLSRLNEIKSPISKVLKGEAKAVLTFSLFDSRSALFILQYLCMNEHASLRVASKIRPDAQQIRKLTFLGNIKAQGKAMSLPGAQANAGGEASLKGDHDACACRVS